LKDQTIPRTPQPKKGTIEYRGYITLPTKVGECKLRLFEK